MFSHERGAFLVLLLVIAAACPGCGTRPSRLTPSRPPIESLTLLYAEYAARYGHGPKSQKEFQRFLEQEGQPRLASIGVEDANDLFESERDGRPFVIVYGIVPAQPIRVVDQSVMSYERSVASEAEADGSAPRSATHAGCIVAYEEEGVGGQRLISYLTVGGDPTDPEEVAKQMVPGLR